MGHDIESRVAILHWLGLSHALLSESEQFMYMVSEGLDDYTTDARGDIGSLVRNEALKTASTIWNVMENLGARRYSN